MLHACVQKLIWWRESEKTWNLGAIYTRPRNLGKLQPTSRLPPTKHLATLTVIWCIYRSYYTFFFARSSYRRKRSQTRTLTPMNARICTPIPMSTSEELSWTGKFARTPYPYEHLRRTKLDWQISRLTKSPKTSRCRWTRRLPLKE
jgi:hypothetical protein